VFNVKIFHETLFKYSIYLQLYGKNDFAEVYISKNLARHRSENNFVGPLK